MILSLGGIPVPQAHRRFRHDPQRPALSLRAITFGVVAGLASGYDLKMQHAFISYASGDRRFVQAEIVDLLKELGLKPWFAPEDIRSGEFWEDSILKGLRSSDWFVVIISTRSAASSWVRREVEWALENLPSRIIPIVIDGCKSDAIDKRMRSIQHLDYGANKVKAIQKLAGRLVKAAYQGLQRELDGRWICAVQPVYYSLRRGHYEVSATGKRKSVVRPEAYPVDGDWHIQNVEIARSSEGYWVDTVAAKGKLQWRWDAALVSDAFLVGLWKSKRESSKSHGYMSAALSRNGTYMFGHDYAVVMEEGKAHFGMLLLGKSEGCLSRAWFAMKSAQRGMSSLKCRIDFPER